MSDLSATKPATSEPITIDCHYIKPNFAAAFLVVDNNHATFVENNTAKATPTLLNALSKYRIKADNIDYLIVTHIHLDHAGGSYALIKNCPNATILAHPRAANHLIDPTKLVTSARKVYGDAAFEELYGEIKAIDASRVRIMQDGETLPFGSHSFNFIYTRGHANHHFCIYESRSNGIFTGDSFGLAYPALQTKGLFIFPSTSPTDFDPAEARISIKKILDTGADKAYLTHFGKITNLPDAAAQLLEHLDFSERLLEESMRSAEPDSNLPAFCEKKLKRHFQNALEKTGLASDPIVWEILSLDLKLNADGIAHVALKRRSKSQNS